MPRPIRFYPGDVVTVSTNDAIPALTTSTVDPALGGAAAANFAVDRCILLGAQALAEAWGKHSKSGVHMAWHEELTDHENSYESSVSAVGGWAKFRFKNSLGRVLDNGVAVIDVVAPDPRLVKIA